MARTKKYIITVGILGLTYLFISTMPYGDSVELKKSLFLFPETIGEWTSQEMLKKEENFPPHADHYVYRKYVNTEAHPLYLNITYWGKFKHEADIFSGNHIYSEYLGIIISEKNIFIDIKGEKVPIKEIIYDEGNVFFSVIYWYHTNHGTTTRRFRERLVNGMDAVLNNRTNVALIKITSERYLNKIPSETIAAQENFAANIFPLLTEFLPFE